MHRLSILEEVASRAFRGPNPFTVLGATPSDSNARLISLCDERQLEAPLAEQEKYRDAVRELTADVSKRCAWTVFAPTFYSRSDETSASAKSLSDILLKGRALEDIRPYLMSFAEFLSWQDSPSGEEMWRRVTHTHSARWQYWHHLALLYNAQAVGTELQLSAQELQCSKGAFDGEMERRPDEVQAYWLQACRCWEHTMSADEFWAVVESVSGVESELRESLPLVVTRQLVWAVERAVSQRNRLCATRHVRLLRGIARNEEGMPLLAAAARSELDSLRLRLWVKIRVLGNNHRRRFDEVFNGLLLLFPDDPQIGAAAFDAMLETAHDENANNRPAQEAFSMCQALRSYAGPLMRAVFPAYPDSEEVAGDVEQNWLVYAHAFTSLLCEMGTVEDRSHFSRFRDALETG